MSTFALALHVVRRDLARNRWIVAAWLILVALATFEAVVGARVPEAAAARLFFLPLGALVLAAGIVQVYPPGGAPPGTPVYWRTLPITLRALLLGRVSAAAVLLCGVPLAGQLVALVALDTPASDVPGHLVASGAPLAGVVLAGLLVGSLTRGIGGAVVLCTALFVLLFPLTFLRSMAGPLPGLLPTVPGIAFAVHLAVAGAALWILALRHALSPHTSWTRIGAVAMVLVLVGVSQSGLFVTRSELRTWSSAPPQEGEPAFTVDVSELTLTRARHPGAGDDGPVQVTFRVTPGEGAPTPSVAMVHLVTLEDTAGNVLLTRTLPGPGPRATRAEPAAMPSEFSTPVQMSLPEHQLEELRSGTLVLVIHGQGFELKRATPVELPLEAGARFTRAGTRVVVDEVSDVQITIRWSAFTSRVPIRAPGPAGAAMLAFLSSNFLEVEFQAPPGEGGEEGKGLEFLRRRGSSGGSFGSSVSPDLVVTGPARGGSVISFEAPTPPPFTARLRIHPLEPTEASTFRMEIPVAFWAQDVR